MDDRTLAKRLRRLPQAVVLGHRVRIARGFRARLLGLAALGRGSVGDGLLIPDCSSVHTFGMRFPLDLIFLDARGAPFAARTAVRRRRFISCRGAVAVLELPSVTPVRRFRRGSCRRGR